MDILDILAALGLVPGLCVGIFAQQFGGNMADGGTEGLGVSAASICNPQGLAFLTNTPPGQPLAYPQTPDLLGSSRFGEQQPYLALIPDDHRVPLG